MPTISGPTQSPSLQAKLPGEIFDGDKQCEMAFWPGIKQCSAKKVNFEYVFRFDQIQKCN